MQSDLKPCPFCGSEKHMMLPPTCDRGTPYDPADRAFPIVRCGGCYTDVPGKDFDASGKSAVEAWNRRSALVDVPAVDPVAKRWLVEEKLPSGSIKWEVVEHENHARKIAAMYRNATVTPLYTSPPLSREGEDSAEVERLRDALEKISDGYGPNHLSAFCRNTAAEALAATPSASATNPEASGRGSES